MPEDTGYGSGRTKLLYDISKEQAFEAKRYDEELTAAEDAAKADSEGSSLWQTLGTVAGALFFGLGGGGIKGAYEGGIAGGEGAKWLHRLFSGYDPEDYSISTDMGKFNVQEAYKMEDVNRQFEDAHKSQFWQDVAGTGKAIGSLAYLGSDLGGMFGETGSEILGKDILDIAPENVYRGQPGDFIRLGGCKSTLWETSLA